MSEKKSRDQIFDQLYELGKERKSTKESMEFMLALISIGGFYAAILDKADLAQCMLKKSIDEAEKEKQRHVTK